MNMDILRKRLEIWKYILFINIGASITLLVEAVLSYQETQTLIFQTSWYGVWLIVQLASFLPGFVLLWGKHWMQIPLLERLNTIFGYFAVVWLTLLPVGLEIEPYTSKTFNIIWLVGGTALAVGYWWLRRRSLDVQNEIFP
jgi:hypothetical protein